MFKILFMITIVIIGVLGYKIYSNGTDTPLSKLDATSTLAKIKTSINPNKVIKNTIVNVTKDNVTSHVEITNEMRHEENNIDEIGEDLQNRSYEEIKNDTSLSEEEREIEMMDKISYEDTHNLETPSELMNQEELEKMMIEDLAHEQELENINK